MGVQLKTGDIILWSGKSLISRAIQYITNSPWSHVAWVWTPDFLVEADWMGVVCRPAREYTDHPDQMAVVRIPVLTEMDIHKVLEEAASKLGRQFDFRLFFGLLWDWLLRRKRSKDTPNTRSAFICSELVARPLWKVLQFRFHDDIAMVNTTPGDIASSPRVEFIFRPDRMG